MTTRISVTEFVRNFADLINRVAYRQERFTLLRGKRALAQVIPIPEAGRLGDLPDLLAGLPRLGEDAAGFEADVARARASLPAVENDPWES